MANSPALEAIAPSLGVETGNSLQAGTSLGVAKHIDDGRTCRGIWLLPARRDSSGGPWIACAHVDANGHEGDWFEACELIPANRLRKAGLSSLQLLDLQIDFATRPQPATAVIVLLTFWDDGTIIESMMLPTPAEHRAALDAALASQGNPPFNGAALYRAA